MLWNKAKSPHIEVCCFCFFKHNVLCILPFSSQTTPVAVYLYRHLKTKSIWSMTMTFRLNLYPSSSNHFSTFSFLAQHNSSSDFSFDFVQMFVVVLLGRWYCVKHCQVESINRAGRYPFYKLSVYVWTRVQRKGVIVLEDKGKQGQCKCTVI